MYIARRHADNLAKAVLQNQTKYPIPEYRPDADRVGPNPNISHFGGGGGKSHIWLEDSMYSSSCRIAMCRCHQLGEYVPGLKR